MLSIVDGEEVGGVVFSTLAARRPELRRELGILRQALMDEEQSGGGDGGTEELKVPATLRASQTLKCYICTLDFFFVKRPSSLHR